jgi:ribokinase
VVQNEIPMEATLQYLRMAHAAKITTVYNPSPMPSRDELRAFPWETINWLLLNEGEAGDIAGAFEAQETEVTAPTVDLPTEARTATEILQRLRTLTQFANVNFVCTLGAAGVVVYLPGKEVIYRPAARLLNPLKDTTGAGDCFAGYFVAGLMRGDDVVKVVDECLVACSICVEIPGAAESVPTRAAVLQRSN